MWRARAPVITPPASNELHWHYGMVEFMDMHVHKNVHHLCNNILRELIMRLKHASNLHTK